MHAHDSNTYLYHCHCQVHAASIMNALKVRFQRDCIYTSIGSILITLNPFKCIAGLYDQVCSLSPSPPSSPFIGLTMKSTTNRTYGKSMQRRLWTWRRVLTFLRLPNRRCVVLAVGKIRQSLSGKTFMIYICNFHVLSHLLLVYICKLHWNFSGESGSGKTESTKHCLQYFALPSGDTQAAASSLSSAGSVDIHHRLMSSNPILEAFGNAKTLRNNNSSRFGKFIEVCFDDSTSITGASITTYLLEKTRVVAHQSDERTYHIFYQLLAGGEVVDLMGN